jgi:hypothetical protein
MVVRALVGKYQHGRNLASTGFVKINTITAVIDEEYVDFGIVFRDAKGELDARASKRVWED